MSQKFRGEYYSYHNGSTIPREVEGVIALFVLGCFGWLYLHQNQILMVSLLLLGIFILFLVAFLIWRLRVKRRFREVVHLLQDQHTDEIHNFINTYGHDKGSGCGWKSRDYCFSESRLNDLRANLDEKGLRINIEMLKDALDKIIDELERSRTQEMIKPGITNITRDLNSLSGTEFELLLKKLFEKIGFAVAHQGRPGDQGGDLVVVKNGTRYLIQAKRYTNSVSNDAVQQAVAALPIYGCQRAVVITTGYFTREAKEVAEAHNAQLVGRAELTEMLSKYLNEAWK